LLAQNSNFFRIPWSSSTEGAAKTSAHGPATSSAAVRGTICRANAWLVGALLHNFDLNEQLVKESITANYLSAQKETFVQRQCILLSVDLRKLDIGKTEKS
jgi:hypothetical protein